MWYSFSQYICKSESLYPVLFSDSVLQLNYRFFYLWLRLIPRELLFAIPRIYWIVISVKLSNGVSLLSSISICYNISPTYEIFFQFPFSSGSWTALLDWLNNITAPHICQHYFYIFILLFYNCINFTLYSDYLFFLKSFRQRSSLLNLQNQIVYFFIIP